MKELALIPFFLSSFLFAQKNTVSTNVAAYAIGNINVQYERQIYESFAASLQYNHLLKGDVPFKGIMKNLAGFRDEKYLNHLLDQVDIKGNSVVLEIRHYFGESGESGFYVAPYYKYSYYNLSNLDIINNDRTLATVKGHINANSGGLLVGTKWKIGKHLSIDWWITGGHFGGGNIQFNGGSAFDLTGMEGELKAALDHLSNKYFNNIFDEVIVDGKTVAIHGTSHWYGIRTGVAVGFNF